MAVAYTLAQLQEGEENMIVSMVKHGDKLYPCDGDKPRVRGFKEGLVEGQVITVEFSKEAPATDEAFHYFHLLRDAYASTNGYNKQYAKDELCVQWGVALPIGKALEKPPKWSGHVVEIWRRKYLRKSTSQYTKQEMSDLIEGTISACIESGVDIEQIVADYRETVNARNRTTNKAREG